MDFRVRYQSIPTRRVGIRIDTPRYVNGIGELRTFDFSQNNTYKATTRLEAYTPITNLETNNYEVDSEDEDEDSNRF